ncbi:membrane protein [Gordonia phage LilyPad]|nr:membrane protein [Gordonia phage LilyPad]
MTVNTQASTRLIFGREPAIFTAIVSAIVVTATAFGTDLNTDQQGLIIAATEAVLAVIVGFTVRETLFPALTGLVKVAVPLLVAFGLDLTLEQQGALLALITLAISFYGDRPQLTPKVNVVEGGVVSGSVVDREI